MDERLEQGVEGVLNINKSSGMTSHDVVDEVRRILGIRKVGHTGTLDPQATGALPICVGNATKIARFLTAADKEYLISMRLGIRTDTLDAEGKVLEEKTEIPQDAEKVEQAFIQFRGEIKQIPPMFSAKKYQGERLYRLARRGETVDRDPVQVKVYELEMISFEPPFVCFRVFCSKGTYARALCDDIGRVLGCGAHLHNLTRLKSGQFRLEDAIDLLRLQEIQEQGNLAEVLLPIEQALTHLPEVRVLPDSSRSILYGASIALQDIVTLPTGLLEGATVRVLGVRRKLLSLAELTVDTDQVQNLHPRKIILRPVKVFSRR
ncbi:MAG: tRNA pseudouridine(55) synthase TruB [bacterium]